MNKFAVQLCCWHFLSSIVTWVGIFVFAMLGISRHRPCFETFLPGLATVYLDEVRTHTPFRRPYRVYTPILILFFFTPTVQNSSPNGRESHVLWQFFKMCCSSYKVMGSYNVALEPFSQRKLILYEFSSLSHVALRNLSIS
jgi:hypothetical protein